MIVEFIKGIALTYIFLTIMLNTGPTFPDLIFILVIGIGMLLSPIPALLFGFINGLFLDLTSPASFGLNTLLLTIVSYIGLRINMLFFQKIIYQNFLLTLLFIIFAIIRATPFIGVISTILVMVPTFFIIQSLPSPSWKSEK